MTRMGPLVTTYFQATIELRSEQVGTFCRSMQERPLPIVESVSAPG